MSNSVEILSTGQVVVQEVALHAIEVTAPTAPATVEVQTQGPQGPSVAANFGLNDLADVNTTSKTAKSILYYDADLSEWRGDSLQTILTVTDGGNFALVAPWLLLLLLLL